MRPRPAVIWFARLGREIRDVPLRIGTSGWQYRHWRDRLYPRGLPMDRWFDRYAESFDTVELNVTFYRQPRPAVFEGWARRAPAGFLFAVKASRFLTHVRRLRDPADSVRLLMDGAARLGEHLGPVLVQLPPDMPAEPARLDENPRRVPARRSSHRRAEACLVVLAGDPGHPP